MRKTLTKLLIICVIYLTIVSCVTPIHITRLPPDPDRVVLSNNSKSNEAYLIIQDYRNELWRSTARYLVGEITKEEHDKQTTEITESINKMWLLVEKLN